MSEITRRLANIQKFPVKIQQEVTTRCTQNCGFCPRQVIGQHRDLGDITPEMVDLVLERYAEVKEPLDVSISGLGEPLLWSGLFDFIDELKEMGITVEMNTNATELTEEKSRWLIGQLDRVQVSLNVPNAEMFKRHKNSDTYELVKNNLEVFFELKGDKKPVTDLRFLKFPETEPLIPQALKEWGAMLPPGDAVIVAEFENWMGAIDESHFGIKYDRTPPEHAVIICSDLFGKYLTITKEGNTYAVETVTEVRDAPGYLHRGQNIGANVGEGVHPKLPHADIPLGFIWYIGV